MSKTKKWYLISSCLTLSIIRYGSRIKWSSLAKGAAPSPTPRCSSYWKGRLRVAFDYGRPTIITTIYIYIYIYIYIFNEWICYVIYHRYTNANIDPWWVGTQLNTFLYLEVLKYVYIIIFCWLNVHLSVIVCSCKVYIVCFLFHLVIKKVLWVNFSLRNIYYRVATIMLNVSPCTSFNILHHYCGDFYKPRKARFIPTFCKRINRTSTAVGRWVTAFEERRRTTFCVTEFIYNKQ